MSKLVPVPSPLGTNRENLFIRASAGAAYDAAQRGTGVDRGRRGARDQEGEVEAKRKNLNDHLARVISDPNELGHARELIDSLVSAGTGGRMQEPPKRSVASMLAR